MSLRRHISGGIALLASAALLTGCASAASTEGTGDPADAPKITFLYSPYADYAPFFIAEEKGYFEDAGIDVELISKSGSSGETYQQVSTGSIVAGGATWGAGLFNATKAGASISVIASVSRIPDEGKNPAPLMVSEQSGITDPKQLKGAKIGIPGDGGFGIYSVYRALDSVGLTLDDVELVNLTPGDIPPALANGSVDASWTIEPISSAIADKKIGHEILDVGYHSGVELGALAFNSEYVDKYPEAVTAFTAAYLRAVQELEAGGWDDPADQAIIAEYTDLPVETLQSIGLTVQDPEGAIDWEDVARQEQFFRDRNTLEFEGDSGIQDIFRADILKQAVAQAGEATAE
ncbi:ABC transporter substrate-binding protein [Leucobacter luti]|uniref:ABC-type nitrate/sulfonate/bicarbonate transport system substrate-binding protein n=1 Tax=Leucobacter luti TaxID=340320 RepID=A0A4R6RTK4_9MICO|nr:ABC transporter substrate-binding protein [Leucobacter luti]MCW2287923.1 NitT/TauT family transport system substrate-binding protein [Leucobacter luti]QYM76079.1 ABC transporter substrate-binding protein [Leucobacter luti]TCK45915.1 ABC-type nitrate/sulfonate/bicarbonate transport system substrate-binding protein [Leucobacter luti]TDP90192.1 ABC-type nitrate/sulfonate/bicarbonate transport system substrate-binding protein [Leucobacter luti]